MPEPLVSVIIPTYNRAEMVVESIESVLAQEFQPLEIVVVDDGSTDNTQEILSTYAGRIVLIYQPNAGVAAARNRGIQEAQGPLIAFQDSDDIMLPGRLTAQVSFMKKHPEVCAVCGNMIIQGKEGINYLEEVCGIQFGRKDWVIIERGFQKLLKYNFMVNPASMVRQEHFLEIGGYDVSLYSAEDWHLWLRMSRKWPLACMKMPYTWKRSHKANITKSPDHITCHIRVIDKALNFGEPIDPVVMEGVGKQLWGLIKTYVRTNIEKPSTDNWRSSIAHWAVHLPWHKRFLVRFVTLFPTSFLRELVRTRTAFRGKLNCRENLDD